MRTLKLTPIVRLMMTMDHEMLLDKGEVFSDEVWKQYLATTENADKQRDAILRSLFWIDAMLAVFLSGKNLKIPVLDISLVDLPACREILTLLSAVTLLFTTMFFINAQCYSLVADRFAMRRASAHSIDPDFISAASKYFHFSLKIFRPKLNIWGIDFYSPKTPFRIYSFVISILIGLVFVLFPVAHFCLTGVSIYQTFVIHQLGILTLSFGLICGLINLLSVAIWIGSSTSFDFDELEPESETVLRNGP